MRDANTTSEYSNSIWRMFIGDMLFKSNLGVYDWESDEEAWESFFHSLYWVKINSYIDYCQKFFEKENDDEWRDDFTERIIEKLNITLKEYKCDGE